MLEAYLPKPAELCDETEVPQGKYVLGRIKSVSDRQRMCYMASTGKKVACYTAKANDWKDVRCDYNTGRLWLADKSTKFDPRRGGFLIDLPCTLVGQKVYMLPHQVHDKIGDRKWKASDATWLASWFLADIYDGVRKGLVDDLARRQRDYDLTPIYRVTLINRRVGEPVCDPVSKKFVFPTHEKLDVIFQGNDVDRMQKVVSVYWPSTREREIAIHNVAGETPSVCTCLPWNPSVELKRVDQLV